MIVVYVDVCRCHCPFWQIQWKLSTIFTYVLSDLKSCGFRWPLPWNQFGDRHLENVYLIGIERNSNTSGYLISWSLIALIVLNVVLEWCWRHSASGLSACPSVHACMHPWSYTESLLTQYLMNCLWEFHQIYYCNAVGNKGEQVRFQGQRSRSRQVLCGQISSLRGIFYLSPGCVVVF